LDKTLSHYQSSRANFSPQLMLCEVPSSPGSVEGLVISVLLGIGKEVVHLLHDPQHICKLKKRNDWRFDCSIEPIFSYTGIR